jgi:hypothetical protein
MISQPILKIVEYPNQWSKTELVKQCGSQLAEGNGCLVTWRPFNLERTFLDVSFVWMCELFKCMQRTDFNLHSSNKRSFEGPGGIGRELGYLHNPKPIPPYFYLQFDVLMCFVWNCDSQYKKENGNNKKNINMFVYRVPASAPGGGGGAGMCKSATAFSQMFARELFLWEVHEL